MDKNLKNSYCRQKYTGVRFSIFFSFHLGAWHRKHKKRCNKTVLKMWFNNFGEEKKCVVVPQMYPKKDFW